MRFSDLYMANDNWSAVTTLVLVDEDLTIIEVGIEAYLADFYYGNHEVVKFKGVLVQLKNLKGEENNE